MIPAFKKLKIDEIHLEHDWHAVALDFEGKGKGKLKIDNDEIKDIRFFSFDEIKEKELAFTHKQLLLSYFKNNGGK